MYGTHLYMILFPNHALVASQLEPARFAAHYQVGSARYYEGKLLFAEIDTKFRHDFFPIDWAFEQLRPHEDGRPKATKFVSCYRVLEHMAPAAIQKLHLAAADGQMLTLQRAKEPVERWDQELTVYAEICPLNMLALSRLDPESFGKYAINPDNPKSVPQLFFARVRQDVAKFMAEYEKNPFVQAPLPGIHPSKLYRAGLEMNANPDKGVKGISLHAPLMKLPFRRLLDGFWFASPDAVVHFPMPPLWEIERRNFGFFRAM